MGLLAGYLGKAARKAPRPSAQYLSVPAPMGSINTISSGAAMPPEDCIFRFNMIPAERGLRLRMGSKEWATGLDGAVRCVMPFTAQVSSSNKVFATTSTGIWDITASEVKDVGTHQLVTFGTSDAAAGYGVFTTMVTAAGHFLVYCDETNGAYIYTETTGLWTTLNVTGVSASALVHVISWKNRLWFTEKNSGRAWFLSLNAIAGAATSQNMGARFAAGGELVGLWSMTYDGGAGMDDSLVAISAGGDVLVYQGTDPTSASTFGLKGVYSVGAVPAGRRIASDIGGDLLIMTRSGLLPLSRLVLAAVQGDQGQYATEKVQNLWNKWMVTRASLRGWHMVQNPEDATLIVVAPVGESVASDQLVMSLHTKGWSQYRDLLMGNAAATFGGQVWYGTVDGKIRIMDGYSDGRTIAAPTVTTAITGSLLTGFQNLGSPRQKRLDLIRPTWGSDSAAPTYRVQARYRWDVTEADAPDAVAAATSGNVWDTAVWDTAIWQGDFVPTQAVHGLAGIGPEVAIAVKVTAASRTVLVGFDLSYVEGGLL